MKTQIGLREGYKRALNCSNLEMSPKFYTDDDDKLMYERNFSLMEEQLAFWEVKVMREKKKAPIQRKIHSEPIGSPFVDVDAMFRSEDKATWEASTQRKRYIEDVYAMMRKKEKWGPIIRREGHSEQSGADIADVDAMLQVDKKKASSIRRERPPRPRRNPLGQMSKEQRMVEEKAQNAAKVRVSIGQADNRRGAGEAL
jgi:hypothetical protein